MTKLVSVLPSCQVIFMPAATLPTKKNYELASIYQPHYGVGGDYFDYIAMPDGRVAVQVAKALEAVQLYLGTVMAGGVFLPLNPAYTGSEVAYFVSDATPRIVVCDEPTSALDVSVQAAILNLLAGLQAERRVSYVFISHDLGTVRYLSDRIAVLYLGRLMEIGPAERVISGPHHPYTEALMSAVPTLDGRAGERVRIRPDSRSVVRRAESRSTAGMAGSANNPRMTGRPSGL